MVIFNKLPTYYADGTATVTANGTTVTGTGTVWTNLQPGDLFGVHKGLAVPIANVVSATELMLLFPWPGAAQTDAPYCVQFIPRSVGVQEATRQLLLMLANGNLDAFAALLGGTDKIPMFTGPGTLTTVSKSELTSGVQADKQVATLADRTTYNNSPTDFKVLVSNVGDGRAALYTKLSNASGDWSTPAYITGPTGADGVNPRGFYDNGTAYVVDDLVYSGGSTWIAKTATTGNAPPTLPTTENAQWRLFARSGTPGVVDRGAYSGAASYKTNDIVLNNGSTWIALQSTSGNAPPVLPTESNAYWRLLARKGMDGTGTGDVVGTASAVDGQFAIANGTTGKSIRFLTPAQASQALGGWEPIGLINISGISSYIVRNLSSFTMLRFTTTMIATAGAYFVVQVSSDNGDTFLSGALDYQFTTGEALYNGLTTISTPSSSSFAGIYLGGGEFFGVTEIGGFNKDVVMFSTGKYVRQDASGRVAGSMGSRTTTSNTARNAIRIQSTSPALYGQILLEGIRG